MTADLIASARAGSAEVGIDVGMLVRDIRKSLTFYQGILGPRENTGGADAVRYVPPTALREQPAQDPGPEPGAAPDGNIIEFVERG
ncbi:MAG: hypothetical protein ABW061_23470 [Polyangiaceae bacterium]